MTQKHLPKQCSPGTDRDRVASAPYNFVPLPDDVITAVAHADDLPDHDCYLPGRHPGYFQVTLTTKSPLYIRCPLSLEEFLQQERKKDEDKPFKQQVKNTPHFFYTRDPDKPVIPGSSLRGMLRSLVEIVGYGKMQWVMDKQLFFRTVDDTAVGRHYRGRMTEKIETGFFFFEPQGYIIKTCRLARVKRDKLNGHLYEGEGQNKWPRWDGQPPCQWARVWVLLAGDGKNIKELSYSSCPEWKEGVLVITGNVPKKKKEFVFLLPNADSEEIVVPEDILERFHDDDQITQWQEKAFTKDKPDRNCRERNGMLRRKPFKPGDPVFFLREEGKLTFLGRAQMFRLPYKNGPLDLIPDWLRRPEYIDFADAIFGFTRTNQELGDMLERKVVAAKPRQGEKGRAYGSRVFVTDAALLKGQADIWLSDDPIVPKILASPKPTAFQHYLVQTSDNKTELKHYGSKTPRDTVIRGHKCYWHQGLSPERGLAIEQIRAAIAEKQEILIKIKEQEEQGKPEKQHTQFKPVKPGVKFQFRLYFENLSDEELGALCWVLNPLGDASKDYCHHLGMGKPLGMGAVKLEAALYRTDRAKRYSALFDGDGWQEGLCGDPKHLDDSETLIQLTCCFEEYVLGDLDLSGRCKHLSELERIAMLLKIMEWPGYPAASGEALFLRNENRPNTRYMTIQPNEYTNRPVLPDPSAFGSLSGNTRPSPAQKTATSSPSEKKAEGALFTIDHESVLKAITSLRGPGEVSRLASIVNSIDELGDTPARIECAATLRQWLIENKLWDKESHASSPWCKRIEQLLR